MNQSLAKVLIIEDSYLDSEYMRELFEQQAKQEKLIPHIKSVANEKDAYIELNRSEFDIVVFDIDLDKRGAGLELLKKFSDKIPFPIISTSRKSEEVITQGYEYGSEHFINKPVSENKIKHIFDDYLNLVQANKKKKLITSKFITEDQDTIFQLDKLLHSSNAPLHINGPTGVGKQIIAELAHELSRSRKNIFIDRNCSTIPENIADSIIFGHSKGAFTGADKDSKGLIESANEGSLFLDEIDKLPLAIQAKLLKVIEQKKLIPVGSTEEIAVSFNLITAASRDIGKLVQEGKFLPDLWERLQGEVLWIKPLCKRPNDIEVQFRHFMRKHESGRLFSIKPDAMNILKDYGWPGNTRELKNLVNRFQKRRVKNLDESHLKPLLQKNLKTKYNLVNLDILNSARENGLGGAIDQITREIIEHSYKQNSECVRKTLVELGISRRLFYKHIPKSEN